MLLARMVLRNFMTFPLTDCGSRRGCGWLLPVMCRGLESCCFVSVVSFVPSAARARRRLPMFGAGSQTVEVPNRRADHAELAVFDQTHRHLLEHRAHRPLVEQPFYECAFA